MKAGDASDESLYDKATNYIYNGDMSIPSNYKQACEYLDIDNFIWYTAFNIYIGNKDSVFKANNWAMWRVRNPVENVTNADGKWRFLAFDTEMSSGLFADDNTVDYVNGAEQLPPPLSPEEEAKTFELLSSDPEKARDLLIVHNLRLVVYIAKKFENTGIGVEDLISIGTIGLIKSIQTFKPDKRIKLATYASRCIENEILMYFRGQRKTAGELSLSDTIETGKDGTSLSVQDVVADQADLFEDLSRKEEALRLRRAVERCLTRREQAVIRLRYGLEGGAPQRQQDVAARLGISRSYVSRIEKKALEKLRAELE
jgi:RNA polymerase sporulation-specific sigma factor